MQIRTLEKEKISNNFSKRCHLTGNVKRQQSWCPLGKDQETQASPSITFKYSHQFIARLFLFTSSTPLLWSRVCWSSQTGERVPQTLVPGQVEGRAAGREFCVKRYLQQCNKTLKLFLLFQKHPTNCAPFLVKMSLEKEAYHPGGRRSSHSGCCLGSRLILGDLCLSSRTQYTRGSQPSCINLV